MRYWYSNVIPTINGVLENTSRQPIIAWRILRNRERCPIVLDEPRHPGEQTVDAILRPDGRVINLYADGLVDIADSYQDINAWAEDLCEILKKRNGSGSYD